MTAPTHSTVRTRAQNATSRRGGASRHDMPWSLPIPAIVLGAAAAAAAPVGAYTGSVLAGVVTAAATTAAVASATLMIRA